MSDTLRRFGIKLVGPIPWGTHLCQFYETKQDLIDILVPYFAEGLRSNEFCMWVTSPPLEVEEARKALKESVPQLDDYIKKGQIEIIPYNKWYLLGGKFDSKRVLQGWVDKEEAALENGFEGLRLTGNTFWIERDLWNSFVDYEEAVNSVIGEHRMIAVCTYCLLSCSGTDVIDVVRNHVGTLIKQAKNWSLIENATRRKLANGALELSERKYSVLFENMVDGFAYHKVLFDGKGKPVDYVFLEANSAFEKLTGLKRDAILGKKATEVLPGIDKDPADWIGVYGKVALTGKPAHFENYAEPLSRWYLVSAFSTEKGYFAATFEDVTQRKKNEKQLEEYGRNMEKLVEDRTLSLKVSEEKYRTLFDSIDEGFCIIEMVFDSDYKPLDYRFLEINASFERQTGMHDAKGKLMRSFAPNHESYWFEIYGKVALTGQPIRFTNEAKELNRYYDVYAFPVGEGKIRNVGILFNDISQRRNLEIQLKDAERLAAIGATAGMVGHDIRNPLQAITSDIYLAKTDLASTPESEEKKNVLESLQEIEKNVDYVNKIVADLQDFARPIAPKIEETNLEQTIHSVFARLDIPENVTVKHSIRRDFPKLEVDPAYLQRILTNLANNAIQAMPKGGKLAINAVIKDGKAVISVEDNGEGIPESVRSKLFTPLVTTKSRGQGFGLSVVKRFTEGMGGTVTFESEEGKGTKFIIELPIQDSFRERTLFEGKAGTGF